jgi:hypothetical protein
MLLASLAVFVLWFIMDFVIHGVILRSTYAATMDLWRPEGEMRMGLMQVVAVMATVAFVGIYTWLVSPKSMAAGIKYGLLYGIGVGVGMGYGTYSVMPIPYNMALTWFLGTIAETVAAGVVTAAIVKPKE